MTGELHTLLSFNLPFCIPIPDDKYEISLNGISAMISMKKISKNKVGIVSSKDKMELMFDKYGISGYSNIIIKLPRCFSQVAG
jgi:hypothetical protein